MTYLTRKEREHIEDLFYVVRHYGYPERYALEAEWAINAIVDREVSVELCRIADLTERRSRTTGGDEGAAFYEMTLYLRAAAPAIPPTEASS